MLLDAGLPRVLLGEWPTSVARLDEVSAHLGIEVWAKLEERAGAWGGNKVRKLEYLLGAAREARVSTLVTYGAGSSSWAAATALHGPEHAFDVVLGLAGPVPEDYERLYAQAQVRVRRAPQLVMLPVVAAAARVSAPTRATVILPAGGSGGVGDVGSAAAGFEIAHAVASGELPPPERVVVACGTGGTAAGLAVGLGVGGMHRPVMAVRVTPRPFGTASLVRRRVRKLLRRAPGVIAAPVISDDRFFGDGYGVATDAGREAGELAAEDGLTLDPTYGAKAFAALVASARRGDHGPLLFVHTSPGPLPQ